MVTLKTLQGLKEKADEINLLLLSPSVDLWRLRELALSEGGLVNDALRKQAWPKLVGLHKFYSVPSRSSQRPGEASKSKKRNRQKQKEGQSSENGSVTDPNHDSRDYCNRQQPQVEIDASMVVAADQAAEEAAAAATAATTRSDDDDEDDSIHHLHPSLLKKTSSGVGSNQSPDATPSKKSTDDNERNGTSKPSQSSVLVESKDAEQIHRDVTRCTWHLLTGSQRSRRMQYKHKDRRKVGSLLHKKQMRLNNLLNWTLFQSSYHHGHLETPEEDGDFLLRYYQGYHDVASVFLAALGGGNHKGSAAGSGDSTSSKQQREARNFSDEIKEQAMDDQEEQEWEKLHADERYRDLEEQAMAMGLDLPSRVLLQLSYSHFRDNLRSSFMQLQVALRLVLFPLLHALDPNGVHAHLVDCDMEPFFCLSWVITWFSHDVRDTDLVKRLFDAFIVSHPLFPVYLSVAMLLHPINRGMILNTDCDFAAVHHCLSMLPRNSCRVGWKKRKTSGDDSMDFGYVSDHGEYEDDDDEEDCTVATDLDASLASEDFGNGSIRLFDNGSEDGLSGSMFSGSLLSGSIQSLGLNGTIPDDEKVPFQELIDTALQFMKRYPPRCLVSLARSYYRANEYTERDFNPYDPAAPRDRMEMQPPMTEEDWDQVSETITILQPSPPIWSLSPTTKADWVLKQRARERMGLKSKSRKDRRTNAKRAAAAGLAGENLEQGDNDDDENAPIPLVDYEYLRQNSRNRAVIACGFGPGEEEERRRRRKRRLRLAATGVLIVGLVAISVVMVSNSYNVQPLSTDSSTSNTTAVAGGEATPSASSFGLPPSQKEIQQSLPFGAESSYSDTCPMANPGIGLLGGEQSAWVAAFPKGSLEPSSLILQSNKDPMVAGLATEAPKSPSGDNKSMGWSTPEVARRQTTFNVHRFFSDITNQWESKLFNPILNQDFPGFSEELTTMVPNPHNSYATASNQRLSTVLLYFNKLAGDVQYNLQKFLDVLGIYFLYFSIGGSGDDDDVDNNDDIDSEGIDFSQYAEMGGSQKKHPKKLQHLPGVKQVRKSVSRVVGAIKNRIGNKNGVEGGVGTAGLLQHLSRRRMEREEL